MTDIQVRIDSDEWYPVYNFAELTSSFGTLITISEEQAAKWRQAIQQFAVVQDEMAKAVGE